MAIAGSGGWVPSNQVRLVRGELHFTSITQNKPHEVLVNDPTEVARLLLAGETVTMDIRYAFTSQVREALNNGRTDSVSDTV